MEKALAYVRYRRGFCSGCGQWLGDWLGPDGKELRDPPFTIVPVLHPCCEMIEEARKERADEGKNKPGEFLAFRRLEDDEPPASEDP